MATGGGTEEDIIENDAASDEEEEFLDAEESLQAISPLSSFDLHSSISNAMLAMDLFLDNKFVEAKEMFQKWADRSMYHALGYGTIMYLQAAMTFESADIEAAQEVVKRSVEVCNRQRRKTGFMESMYRNKNSYDDMTPEEVHAELCYAECLLERAMLTFIQDENLLSFIKGGLKIKACLSSYKESVRIMKKRNWKDADERMHFESGVCMGVGAFNLMISLLPSRILKLLEFVGFKGSKRKGLHELEAGATLGHSMRGPLCSMSLLGYHTMVSYVLGIGDGDTELAERLLEQLLVRYPHGALFLFYAGRIQELKGNIDKAIIKFEESVDSQNLWPQFHHFCFWELMWCHSFNGDWLMAMKYSEKLLTDSKWSKATYAYQKAAFLMMHDEQTEDTIGHVAYLMEQVPKLKQRIAGKSLPIEKFALKKSEQFFEQGKRLTLPAYELIYVWNGFTILSKCPTLLKPILSRVEGSLKELELNKSKISRYFDDYSLLMLIKGVCLKHLGHCDQAEACFQEIHSNEKEIKVDKYILPSALFELGMLYISQNRLDEAKETLNSARHNYKGYSLESRIHFRLQAASLRVKSLQNPNSDDLSQASDDLSPLDSHVNVDPIPPITN